MCVRVLGAGVLWKWPCSVCVGGGIWAVWSMRVMCVMGCGETRCGWDGVTGVVYGYEGLL
jgi:hypothetical protein